MPSNILGILRQKLDYLHLESIFTRSWCPKTKCPKTKNLANKHIKIV